MRKEFCYSNPIDPDVITNIRDPFIILEGDTYYLTGTIPPYWSGRNDGVKLWKSKDLLHWREVGFILRSSVASEDSWFRDFWWASEIHRKGGRFYLTVNCRNGDLGIGQNPLVAVSDTIDGSYTVLNPEEPFFTKEKKDSGITMCPDGNDANLFTDDDGRTYMTVCCWDGIITYEIDLDRAVLKDGGTMTVAPSDDGWDTKIEGQFIIKRGDTYICFYSSFTRSYEVGVSYAKNIRGPWVKDSRNPIIVPDISRGLIHTGHNSIFSDRDGDLWTSYLITLNDRPGVHLLAIDPIDFDGQGRVVTPAPTLGKVSGGYRETPVR